jgi:8-oxo-dGTP pyrophosphatase MutT (NUDIX family)
MTREKKRYLIETHVAGICFRETETDIEVLIAKRRSDRKLYPSKWECGGGQVRAGENFTEAIKREMRDEFGITIQSVVVFGTYEIKVPDLEQKKIPGIKFVCFFEGFSDGEGIQIEKEEFSQWRWQSINNLSGINFIQGVREDIRTGWEFYTRYKNVVNHGK